MRTIWNSKQDLNNFSKAVFGTTGEQWKPPKCLHIWQWHVHYECIYRCNLNSIEKHQLFGSGVSSKGRALYLQAFHSRHHLFVPSGRKFSGRNNDQIEAGLWRQESKNSSCWIEGIDNDSVFHRGSEINHRLRGEDRGKEEKKKKKPQKKTKQGKYFYRS